MPRCCLLIQHRVQPGPKTQLYFQFKQQKIFVICGRTWIKHYVIQDSRCCTNRQTWSRTYIIQQLRSVLIRQRGSQRWIKVRLMETVTLLCGKKQPGQKGEFAEPECGIVVCHRSNQHGWSTVLIKPQQQITLCANGPIIWLWEDWRHRWNLIRSFPKSLFHDQKRVVSYNGL